MSVYLLCSSLSPLLSLSLSSLFPLSPRSSVMLCLPSFCSFLFRPFWVLCENATCRKWRQLNVDKEELEELPDNVFTLFLSPFALSLSRSLSPLSFSPLSLFSLSPLFFLLVFFFSCYSFSSRSLLPLLGPSLSLLLFVLVRIVIFFLFCSGLVACRRAQGRMRATLLSKNYPMRRGPSRSLGT